MAKPMLLGSAIRLVPGVDSEVVARSDAIDACGRRARPWWSMLVSVPVADGRSHGGLCLLSMSALDGHHRCVPWGVQHGAFRNVASAFRGTAGIHRDHSPTDAAAAFPLQLAFKSFHTLQPAPVPSMPRGCEHPLALQFQGPGRVATPSGCRTAASRIRRGDHQQSPETTTGRLAPGCVRVRRREAQRPPGELRVQRPSASSARAP